MLLVGSDFDELENCKDSKHYIKYITINWTVLHYRTGVLMFLMHYTLKKKKRLVSHM